MDVSEAATPHQSQYDWPPSNPLKAKRIGKLTGRQGHNILWVRALRQPTFGGFLLTDRNEVRTVAGPDIRSRIMQNKSHAVMAQRVEAKDSLDDFPTPPWATRALIEHVIDNRQALMAMSSLEPACGAGHMAKVLKEYFAEVVASDAHPYGYGDVRDFLAHPFAAASVDWVITNPPFRLAEEFILKSLAVARQGVCMLVRTTFIESVGRYERLFRRTPPTKFAQFSERVPMVKGRLDAKASTATGYCWLVWEKLEGSKHPRLMWIPACRKQLERPGDYVAPNLALPSALANQPRHPRKGRVTSKSQSELFRT
jgi:hypothetical protein